MLQVHILGPLFLLISHMDQEIETITVWITVGNSQELLLMKQHQVMNVDSKCFQQASALVAVKERLW